MPRDEKIGELERQLSATQAELADVNNTQNHERRGLVLDELEAQLTVITNMLYML